MKKFICLFVFILFVFSLEAFSAVKTWDGGGADNNLLTAANWVGDVAPVVNDDLIFPANAAKFSVNNNSTLLSTFRSITFEGGNYTFGGSALRLIDGLKVNAGVQAINTIVNLAAPQTFFAGEGSVTTIAVLSVGNFPLIFDGEGIFVVAVITGTGAITKNGLGATLLAVASGFSGAININNGIFVVDAIIPNSSVTVNAPVVIGQNNLSFGGIGGTGTIGATNIVSGAISAGSFSSPIGVLTVQGNLNVSSNGYVVIKIGSRASAIEADRIKVNGTVNLSNPTLAPVFAGGNRPAIGQSFEIISNDGADAVVGAFANLPEGASFNGGLGLSFRITYRGGDGNDVVITRVNRAAFDFDGDGKSDISVFRPSNSVWYQLLSGNGSVSTPAFGLSDDRIVPADYDGDNKTDIAVFRPSNGVWFVLRSSDSVVTFTQFGLNGDVPVPNDYDGDGRADVAVFRPSDGTWYQLRSLGNRFYAEKFGQNGDIPQIGDFDGDGLGDLAVYRQGVWHQLLSRTNAYSVVPFGLATDKPVPADYDGDGITDLAVYRDGVWYLLRSATGFTAIQFGLANDKPVVGDYDGDAKADLAVYRDGVWYLLRSTEGSTVISFGLASDKPIPGAFLE